MGKRNAEDGGSAKECPHLSVRASSDNCSGWARSSTILKGGIRTQDDYKVGCSSKDEGVRCELSSGESITLKQLVDYCRNVRHTACDIFARRHHPEKFPKSRRNNYERPDHDPYTDRECAAAERAHRRFMELHDPKPTD